MNSTEKFYIDSYHACSEEDDYNNGIVLGGSSSYWTDSELAVDGSFDKPTDALKKLCETLGFTYRAGDWENDPVSENDYGRFDTDFLVDEYNREAYESQIEKWRNGERKLWTCHVSVMLKIRAVRNVTQEEAVCA